MFKIKTKNIFYIKIFPNRVELLDIKTKKQVIIKDVKFSNERSIISDFDMAEFALKKAVKDLKFTRIFRPIVFINCIFDEELTPLEKKALEELGLSGAWGRKVFVYENKELSKEEMLELASDVFLN